MKRRTPARSIDWKAAEKHLAKVDPRMKRIIAKVGPCRLSPRRDYFVHLCNAIFSQQLSTKIARILFDRFCSIFPRNKLTPAAVIKALEPGCDEERLKGCGLSRQKRAYVLDLARHFHSNEIPVRKLSRMSDEEIIESLTRVKGVGRWTAEMFLIFVLNRPDVWPVDDLGLREAIKRLDKLDERPTPKQCIERGDVFKPYRSVATWYLWRSLS